MKPFNRFDSICLISVVFVESDLICQTLFTVMYLFIYVIFLCKPYEYVRWYEKSHCLLTYLLTYFFFRLYT